ncbi:signal peptidase I [Candidatus Woesearchaeota archaeon]|jgi:signal peptidase I|nr:signal peptidase I [Candidatus Woesearchaeota archaeon]MBT4111423.1 signal peptidase I [Candidatus Woesearchaeota archaeon]MBT4336352.1 signal peptidase I [Candidatus Woesearchaeota archaeon]MBT4469993.1 signal peptidase I [Candidatus Woesearchaeota archaeon]MBT6744283.1 signal peptidase I [Candidatus Woesearchaeota archaeon]
MGVRDHSKRAWKFFWEDDSVWSWIANIIVAFLVIRFIVYPVLGLVLGTSFPIVAVISESMEHGTHNDIICGQKFVEFPESFDSYWQVCGQWYESNGITKEEFKKFPFRDGFRKGDVIILWRANKDNIDPGDVLIFQGSQIQPIIHRVVKVWEEEGSYYYQTKGDHNKQSLSGSLGEEKISEDRIFGKGMIKIPYLGWAKILFVDAVRPLGIVIER